MGSVGCSFTSAWFYGRMKAVFWWSIRVVGRCWAGSKADGRMIDKAVVGEREIGGVEGAEAKECARVFSFASIGCCGKLRLRGLGAFALIAWLAGVDG